jgi:hypothetical protein
MKFTLYLLTEFIACIWLVIAAVFITAPLMIVVALMPEPGKRRGHVKRNLLP